MEAKGPKINMQIKKQQPNYLPPRRGQVKARIFAALVEKVEAAASHVVGLGRSGSGGNGGCGSGDSCSDSAALQSSSYTSEGDSDYGA
ncbi:hypothetical protein U1Q18_026061 [Sarracenia purpurea var. burkii]